MNFNLTFLIGFYLLLIHGLNVYLFLHFYFEYFLHFFEATDSGETYDYIIVGCGTAGSVIAGYLSSHDKSFLVLEAGGSGGPLLNPPALGPLLQGTFHDWKYKTTPQDNACLAMSEKRCMWPMGKILGGSAKLNNMIHIRGYLNEIASWFDNKYNISELTQHLVDLEDSDLPYERLKFKTKLSLVILNAALESGFNVNDLYDHTETGFMEPFVNQINGGRWSTSHTLQNNHYSLISTGKIVTNARVEKILFDLPTKTARGVMYERFGKMATAFGKKGVIITSGAIGSPKILMLSGIGPKNHLDSLGIPVIKDLPVGDNLVDHVTTGIDLVLLNQSLNFDTKTLLNPMNAWHYFTKGEGPWTSSGCEIVAILKTFAPPLGSGENIENLPDLQLMVLPLGLSTDHGIHFRKAIGITDDIWQNYFSKISSYTPVTILPIVLHPKSKGTVRLASTRVSKNPLINPNYFSDINDMNIILKGIESIKMLLQTKSMMDLGATLNPIPFPGCDNYNFDTREYWECYVRHLTLTTYHPAGTCKMGYSNDNSSVVGHNFQVIGVNNLFVADASIFPALPSGNINTAVALIAKLFTESVLKHK